MRGSAALTRRSKNSYMRLPRSVTMTPIGMPSRRRKFAIDFLARVMTGFWPVIVAMSAEAESSARAFSRASPRPMFSMIFCRRGTSIGFL